LLPPRYSKYIILALLSVPACADEGLGPGGPVTHDPFPLTVWNRSQFDLEQVRVATTFEQFLTEPLPHDGHIFIPSVDWGARISVVRYKVEHGPLIAYTTAEGLELSDPGYTLVVFAESFRLLYPTNPDNPWAVVAYDSAQADDGARPAGD
jgi:hypothetical protein